MKLTKQSIPRQKEKWMKKRDKISSLDKSKVPIDCILRTEILCIFYIWDSLGEWNQKLIKFHKTWYLKSFVVERVEKERECKVEK